MKKISKEKISVFGEDSVAFDRYGKREEMSHEKVKKNS